VADILGNARAGLLVLKPVEHEMVTLPIKLFEYMAAGIPVISSDFPVWRKIVEGAGCGLLVDPGDTDAIAGAMQWILDNPEEAQAMGDRGRRAVVDQLNWDVEAKTMSDFYRDVLRLA
jgi:glycosyltransferase involved in cell wall biosynthesis